MKPVLIITRPAPDGARFAGLVEDVVDVEVVLSPLLEIVPMDAESDAQAFVFTSTNGVAQAERLGLPRGRAWCVGDRTAQMAREAGFDAISAQGTIEDLLALILVQAHGEKLAHIRGKEARGDLAPRLRVAGIDCSDVIAYAQREMRLSLEARTIIEGDAPAIIPLFSPRSATILRTQVTIGANAVVVAISDAVAEQVSGCMVKVAQDPSGAAMLVAVIDQCRSSFQ